MGKIRFNEKTNELAIGNWLKYNSSTSPLVKTCIDKEFALVKDTVLIEYVKSMDTQSQEEEEEEEEEKEDIKFNFKKALIDLGIDKRLATEWLAVRKKKSLTNSKTAFEDFTNEVKKSGASPNDVLRLCIVKSWGGFKANWYKDEIAKQQQTSPQPLQQSQQTGLSLSSIPDIA
jgi:hypothetical protein